MDKNGWKWSKGSKPHGLCDGDLIDIRRGDRILTMMVGEFNWEIWVDYRPHQPKKLSKLWIAIKKIPTFFLLFGIAALLFSYPLVSNGMVDELLISLAGFFCVFGIGSFIRNHD